MAPINIAQYAVVPDSDSNTCILDCSSSIQNNSKNQSAERNRK